MISWYQYHCHMNFQYLTEPYLCFDLASLDSGVGVVDIKGGDAGVVLKERVQIPGLSDES